MLPMRGACSGVTGTDQSTTFPFIPSGGGDVRGTDSPHIPHYSHLQCLVMLVWRPPWTGAGEGPDIATIIRDIIITSMIYENHFVVFVRYNVCRHCPPSLRGDYKD